MGSPPNPLICSPRAPNFPKSATTPQGGPPLPPGAFKRGAQTAPLTRPPIWMGPWGIPGHGGIQTHPTTAPNRGSQNTGPKALATGPRNWGRPKFPLAVGVQSRPWTRGQPVPPRATVRNQGNGSATRHNPAIYGSTEGNKI